MQHPPPGPGLPLPQRLFGQGPQALWPPNATTLARQTLASMALPWRGGPFRWKQRKTGADGTTIRIVYVWGLYIFVLVGGEVRGRNVKVIECD